MAVPEPVVIDGHGNVDEGCDASDEITTVPALDKGIPKQFAGLF
jgi:hypothetical protein